MSATPAAGPTSQRRQVADAYVKAMQGKRLTKAEKAELKRFEKDREEKLRWEYYQSIPKKHWRQMSGRQTKVINEQAGRYGLPFGGPTIDLAEVVRALHDFLAKHAQKLAQDDDQMMRGGSSPALERYREERALLARLDRLERQRELIAVQEMRGMLDRFAGVLRRSGETLERRFGPDAMQIYIDAINDGERIAHEYFEAEQRDPSGLSEGARALMEG